MSIAYIVSNMDERELSLAVVGIDYPNPDKGKSDRRFEMLVCEPGERVVLRLEPKNKHDELAVAVFSSRGIQLGYLTAERCGWIGSKIRAGDSYEAVFQEPAPTAAIIRIRFGGGAPTLPPARPRAVLRPEGDFHPDPDGPMWGA